MKFRPCIDIHNGQVKQIVGASLQDAGDRAAENFASTKPASDYAALYQADGLRGGHIILLNSRDSEYYEATRQQALGALAAYPGGMQVGGGIQADNAADYIGAGASHVIVTSYAFKDGQIQWDHLEKLKAAVGRDHVVLDLSCKYREDAYYIVTDRWQKFTSVKLSEDTLCKLSDYADEFLVHAADVEGQQSGIDRQVVEILGSYRGLPVTYAGGVRNMEDLELIRSAGHDRVDVTIGSALDLFGGKLSYREVVEYLSK